MARGPKGERRFDDPAKAAVHAVRIALGELSEEFDETATIKHKNPAAVALGELGGRKGGVARNQALTSEQRSQIAAMGAAARWGKSKKRW